MENEKTMVFSTISDSVDRFKFEGQLNLDNIPYEIKTQNRITRLGYSIEIMEYYVDKENIERVKIIIKNIEEEQKKEIPTEINYPIIIFVIILLLLITFQYFF